VHSTATDLIGQLKAAPPGQRFLDVDRVYSEVRVVNGVVTQIGGKPGGPKGALNPDLVGTQQGQTLSVGDTNLPQKVEATGDIKTGGGTIAPKYTAVGGQQVTVNGVTNSADTDPNLLKPSTQTGTVSTSPKDANVNAATGEVVPGPKTSAVMQRRAQSGGSGTGSSRSSSSGGGSGPGAFSAGMTATISDAGRQLVPGAAALEGALVYGAMQASQYAPALVTPLLQASQVVPAAAGAGALGAIAGHVVQAGAEAAGATPAEAKGAGLVTAVVAGAALGSFIPVIGTLAGAIIGGALAGGMFLLTQ
jgi:hypothetical protein